MVIIFYKRTEDRRIPRLKDVKRELYGKYFFNLLKYQIAILFVLPFWLFAQPTIDGDMGDANYSTIGTYSADNGTFGTDNDVGVIKYYCDGTDMYVGITGELSSNNNIVLFMNFSGYNGRGSSVLGGTDSDGDTGIFTTSGTSGDYGLDGATMDMDVDFAFAFNEGNGTSTLYLDCCRYSSGDAILDSRNVGNTGSQSGSSATQDPTGCTGGTGNIIYAYHNGFASDTDKGVEFKIPIASFSGADNTQTVQFFAIITNSTGFLSNECIPGDPGDSNLGNDYDLTGVSGQNFYTSTSDGSLPVELTSFNTTPLKSAIKLNWVTESEIDNLGFLIDRSLEPISGFTTIADYRFVPELQGQGSVTYRTDYSYTDREVIPGTKYYYVLSDVTGNPEHGEPVTRHTDKMVSATPIWADPKTGILKDFRLLKVYPNPFNPVAAISYASDVDGNVRMEIVDMNGNVVKSLINDYHSAGSYELDWAPDELSAGVYFCRMISAEHQVTRKIIYLK